jgi:hypothetical protein
MVFVLRTLSEERRKKQDSKRLEWKPEFFFPSSWHPRALKLFWM